MEAEILKKSSSLRGLKELRFKFIVAKAINFRSRFFVAVCKYQEVDFITRTPSRLAIEVSKTI
jgi:hypothetical protein